MTAVRDARGRRATLATMALCVSLAACAGAAPAGPASPEGLVRYMKDARTSFNAQDRRSNSAWILAHFSRMLTYSPFFDSRTRWYDNAWVYADSYAIYRNSAIARRHPGWILKDASGQPLFIPYGAGTEYAADISNPAYRKFWVAQVRATVARGYRGVFVDDVNLWADVAHAGGGRAVALSGVTGRPISDEAFRSGMVALLRELRAAIPGREIVENSVWYADGGSANRGTTAAIVRAQIQTADVVMIERGVNDGGLTGGSGQWSVSNLLTYIDEVHSLGRSVIIGDEAASEAAREYTLAAYLLISTGRDYVTGGETSQTVGHLWPGWSTDLGAAKGPRYTSGGLIRRDFAGGSVYLNPPGGRAVTVGGHTLGPASGLVVPTSG